jgi:hypothetical protein
MKIPIDKHDLKWINQITIQTLLDNHQNIVKLIGFRRLNNIYCIIMEIADKSLLDQIKSITFNDRQSFANRFYKVAIEIITAMVRNSQY